MAAWFYDPSNTFQMFSLSHLATIGVIISFVICTYLFRAKLVPHRKIIRITIGLLLIFSRLSLDVWYVVTGNWDVTISLPLELCSLASLVSGIMLFTKSRLLLNMFYFISLGGAMQAIATPALDFGFPQYRYIQFFTDHTMLILAPLLLIWLYDLRPTWKSVWTAFFAINVIAGAVFIINQLIQANYMFLRHKPSTASLLDILGPYPYYLAALEGITLVVFILLYVPFVLTDKLKQA